MGQQARGHELVGQDGVSGEGIVCAAVGGYNGPRCYVHGECSRKRELDLFFSRLLQEPPTPCAARGG